MENSNVTPLVPKDKNAREETSLVSSLSPREIVSELDRFVVGQNKAKKAVAVALRNRWRRQALKGEMKNEVLPKNILKFFCRNLILFVLVYFNSTVKKCPELLYPNRSGVPGTLRFSILIQDISVRFLLTCA